MARVVDLETAVDVLGGKIEFETGEEGREHEILDPPAAHRDRRDGARRTSAASTSALLVDALEDGALVTTGEQVTAARLPRRAARRSASPSSTTTSATASAPRNDGERAGAIELALEGLYLARKISKETDGGETVYG